jgi:hypothetical protein
MIIECILRRSGGTKIDIFGQDYDFQPNEQGAHVAEVADEQAIERLLSITEAYREYGVQASVKTEQGDDEPTDYLITNVDGSDLDLGKFEKEDLIKFAEANNIRIDKRKNRDDLAKAIFEAVTA